MVASQPIIGSSITPRMFRASVSSTEKGGEVVYSRAGGHGSWKFYKKLILILLRGSIIGNYHISKEYKCHE